jgi:hypothetical protein
VGNTNSSIKSQPFLFATDKNSGEIVRVVVTSPLQVGTINAPAELHVTGDLAISTLTIIQEKSILDITDNVSCVCVSNASGNAITVRLPINARVGQLLTLKDESYTAATLNLIVTSQESGVSVEGNTSYVISSNGAAATFIKRDSDWSCISSFSIGSGGGSGTTNSYLTVNTESGLPNSRTLNVGGGLSKTDTGASLTLQMKPLAYVTVGSEPELTGSRSLAGSSNVSINDSGPLSSVSIDLTDTTVTAGTYQFGTTVVDAKGRITSASNGPPGGSVWVDGGHRAYATGSIAISNPGVFTDSVGSDVYHYVSGSKNTVFRQTSPVYGVTVFGGDTVTSGSIWVGDTSQVRISSEPLMSGSPAELRLSAQSGTMMSMKDVLGPVLFQVNDNSGLPLFTVSEDDSIVMGQPFTNAFILSGSYIGMGIIPPNKNNILYGSGNASFTGLSGSLTQLQNGLSYLLAGNGMTIASASNGQVTIGVDPAAVIGADKSASYLVLSLTSSLDNERVLSASNGLLLSDSGGNNKAILSINDNVIPFLSGATFVGTLNAPIVSATSLTGSLTLLKTGLSYLVAGANISITSASNGQVTIVGTGGGGSGQWIDGINRLRTTGSVSIDASGRFADQIGSNVGTFVSSSTGPLFTPGGSSNPQLFSVGGDANISGSLYVGNTSGSTTVPSLALTNSSIVFDATHYEKYVPGSGSLNIVGNENHYPGDIGVNKWDPKASIHVVALGFDGTFEKEIGTLGQPFYSYGTALFSRTNATSNTGAYCAGSSPSTTGLTANLETVVTTYTTWTPSFYYKLSIYSSDSLKFYVNGSLVQTFNGPGVGSFTQFTGSSYPPGTYTLKWEYLRNNSGGSNTVWVDDVVISLNAGYYKPAALFESGSVGVGTISPFADLHVVGTTILQGNTLVTSGTLTSAKMSGSLTTLVDGTPYLIAASGIQLVTGSNGAVTISTTGGIGGGAKVPIYTLPIATAQQNTNYLSGSKYSIGACYYNPTVINQFSGTLHAYWRAVVETSNITYPAAVDLYDLNGVISGTPAMLVSSSMTTGTLAPTQLQADLTSIFSTLLSPILLEGRLWMTVSSSVGDQVTCKNARIDLEFT